MGACRKLKDGPASKHLDWEAGDLQLVTCGKTLGYKQDLLGGILEPFPSVCFPVCNHQHPSQEFSSESIWTSKNSKPLEAQGPVFPQFDPIWCQFELPAKERKGPKGKDKQHAVTIPARLHSHPWFSSTPQSLWDHIDTSRMVWSQRN